MNDQPTVRFEGKYAILRVPYNEEFLKAMHGMLPQRSHWWDKYHREWKISKEHWPDINNLVTEFFNPPARKTDTKIVLNSPFTK